MTTDVKLVCPICGGIGVSEMDILWPELIEAWNLTLDEVLLINRQQGQCCLQCGSNLRSRTLAGAINECFSWPGTLRDLVNQPNTSQVRLLEINEAGNLSYYLHRFRKYEFASYPDVDMQRMDLPSDIYDIVVHSDTLEHIPNPVLGLQECRRILRPKGRMLMTIPIVPTRLTRRRDNMPLSYHGNPAEKSSDFIVCTEYGADFYIDMVAAGWKNISLYTLGSLDSLAIIGTK